MSHCRSFWNEYKKCLKESSYCSYEKNKLDSCTTEHPEEAEKLNSEKAEIITRKQTSEKDESGIYFDPFSFGNINIGGGLKYRLFAPDGKEGFNYHLGSGFYYKF